VTYGVLHSLAGGAAEARLRPDMRARPASELAHLHLAPQPPLVRARAGHLLPPPKRHCWPAAAPAAAAAAATKAAAAAAADEASPKRALFARCGQTSGQPSPGRIYRRPTGESSVSIGSKTSCNCAEQIEPPVAAVGAAREIALRRFVSSRSSSNLRVAFVCHPRAVHN